MSDMRTTEELAKEAVDLLVQMTRQATTPAFIENLTYQHRTHQQAVTGLMLKWFKHLSELPESGFDLRNEHAVKVARKIRVLLEEEYGSAWTHLPRF